MPAQTKGRVITGRRRQKPTPTTSLEDGPLKIFNHVVKSVDPDHFSAVDLPLLTEYCTAAHQARVAAAAMAVTGTIVDGKSSPWLVVQEKSVRAMVALSARLRICPQSRFDRLVAGANSRAQPLARTRKPWEYAGGATDDEDDGLLAR